MFTWKTSHIFDTYNKISKKKKYFEFSFGKEIVHTKIFL